MVLPGKCLADEIMKKILFIPSRKLISFLCFARIQEWTSSKEITAHVFKILILKKKKKKKKKQMNWKIMCYCFEYFKSAYLQINTLLKF
jgi:hypothetical protein